MSCGCCRQGSRTQHSTGHHCTIWHYLARRAAARHKQLTTRWRGDLHHAAMATAYVAPATSITAVCGAVGFHAPFFLPGPPLDYHNRPLSAPLEQSLTL